jgi:hypothetical protein
VTTTVALRDHPRHGLLVRAPSAGVHGGILMVVAGSLFGDTPDTRDSTAEIARYFVEHRTNVLTGVVLSAGALLCMLTVTATVSDLLELGGDRRRAKLMQSSATVAATVMLCVTYLTLAALSYVVSSEAPHMAKGLFELTLVAAPITAGPLAVVMWCTATGLQSTGKIRGWFRTLSGVFCAGFGLAACGFAYSGPLSPDVGQQIVLTQLLVWLLASGRGLRPNARPHEAGGD